MARIMMYYSVKYTFSKDGGLRTIHFKPVIENVDKCKLTLRRLLRSRPKWNCGTAHIL